MVVALLYEIQTPCHCSTLSLSGSDSHTAYHQHLILIWRYCWMRRPRPTLHDHVHETGSTDRHATSFA